MRISRCLTWAGVLSFLGGAGLTFGGLWTAAKCDQSNAVATVAEPFCPPNTFVHVQKMFPPLDCDELVEPLGNSTTLICRNTIANASRQGGVGDKAFQDSMEIVPVLGKSAGAGAGSSLVAVIGGWFCCRKKKETLLGLGKPTYSCDQDIRCVVQ